MLWDHIQSYNTITITILFHIFFSFQFMLLLTFEKIRQEAQLEDFLSYP